MAKVRLLVELMMSLVALVAVACSMPFEIVKLPPKLGLA